VKEQLGHASIQITVDTYGHLIPGANRAAVDRLDDDATQPDATKAQPEPFDDPATLKEMQELFGKVVSRVGIEPTTRRLRVCCSAN
jgi:integrase